MSDLIEYCEACGGRITHEDGCVAMRLEAEIERLTAVLDSMQMVNIKKAETIERLTALTEADAKEIGSYRDETGLRGEIKNKDAELDAADEKIERLQARVEELEAALARSCICGEFQYTYDKCPACTALGEDKNE